MKHITVVGRGKVGSALFRAFVEAGLDASLIDGRLKGLSPSAANARLFVLAVPDAKIAEVAAALAPRLPRGATVVHCAGARSSDELSSCRARGAAVAAMHPVLSFASPRAQTSLRGATFLADGDARALRVLRGVTRALGVRLIKGPRTGAGYHAAIALLANGAAALADQSARLLVLQGFSQREAEHALASLLATVAANIEQVGVPRALTGPIVRGDAATVRAHLAAVRKLDRAAAADYQALGPVILRSALRAGLATHTARAVAHELAQRQTPKRGASRGARAKSRRPRQPPK